MPSACSERSRSARTRRRGRCCTACAPCSSGLDRNRLTGTVEVDETYFGGEEPGLRGGRQKGKKVLVGIAVERREPKGFGRCRMAILADGSAESLH
ncbi:MAG: transposase, partial [Ferrimicrobium sp.]